MDGRLDAALLSEPYLSAVTDYGVRALDSPYGDLGQGSTALSYFVADATWLSSHGDQARRFASIIHRTHADLQANPVAYRAALARHLGLDQAIADRVALPTLETRVTVAQVQRWVELLPQLDAGHGVSLPLVSSDILFDSVR
ncbi:MAG TPA: hypothetical protein VK066_07335 [Chloroflexota bacterium]|nr:hypothetical protein [Chloroflexota bacterium]